MSKITFELVLGDDQATYDNLSNQLPKGQNNLVRGVVVPAHPQNQPQTFKVGNLSPGIPYVVDFEGEWQAAPKPRVYFTIPTMLSPATGNIVITYTSLAVGDTLVIAGVTFTAVIGAATNSQFKIEVDAFTTAENLASAINANTITSALVKATVTSADIIANQAHIQLKAIVLGSSSNQYTLSSSSGAIIVPSTLSGGADETRAKDSLSYSLTISLPYGPVTVSVRDTSTGEVYRFLLSVVNYATLFRAYAREITEYLKNPTTQVEDSIASPLSFRLATPMLAGLTSLIPSDLEILASLAHKLLVKNLLHAPGTEGATTEILAAFSASNPIFFKMQNTNKLDTPLFRSEEVFQGYEAHVWLPNREIERWRAFIQLINNLPQLYTLKQITEGEVYVQKGNTLKRHTFDFSSPLANSITAGMTYLTDCFLRLFSLSVTVEAEHFLAFCQASYILDQLMLNALTPTDADPLAITPWQTYSLSGRFEQQFDISNTHEWYYDSPVLGETDGVNRFFSLSKFPASISAVKIFVDGLLKFPYIDYRITVTGDTISNAYRIQSLPEGPLLISAPLGVSRSFLAPVFSSFECKGGANLQMLLTGVEQGLDNVSFVISHEPTTDVLDAQFTAVHFSTPKLPNSGISGENQYGQISLPVGANSYAITYNQPTVSIDYQLLVSLTVDPMPSGNPENVEQVIHLVREHTLTGATVEFSAPVGADVKLNWWVIEDDTLTLERGTIPLLAGMSSVLVSFAGGPYFDQVVILFQLWETYPTFTDAPHYLASATSVGPGGTTIRFSAPIVGNDYRLDYVVFPARDGNFIEFYEPPVGLVEAHYDVRWPYWMHAELTPAPDGIRREFTLPYPVTEPKSVYLALNGRLMTQGIENQYTVANDMVLFSFAPTPNQLLWAVYPISTPTNILPSKWDQNLLNYLPEKTGEYATGWIKANGKIAEGSLVTLDGLMFEAVATSRGLIINGSTISVGASVTWNTLNVTLTGAPNPNVIVKVKGTMASGSNILSSVLPSTDGIVAGMRVVAPNIPTGTVIITVTPTTLVMSDNATANNTAVPISVSGVDQFKVGQSKDEDTQALVDAINSHAILSYHYVAESSGSGFTVVKAKRLGNGQYNETLTTFGTLEAFNIEGDTSSSSYNAKTIYAGEHKVSLPSSEVNISSSLFYRQGHPYYEGLGITVISSNSLPTPLIDGVTYYVTNPTVDTFQLSLVPYGTPVVILDSGLGYHTFTSVEVDVSSSTFSFPTTEWTGVGTTAPNSPIISDISPNLSLVVGMAVFGSTIPLGATILSIESDTQITLTMNATNVAVSTQLSFKDVFQVNEPVGFLTSNTLPSGLIEGQIYYIINVTQNRFQISATQNGSAVTITDVGAGEFVVYSIPRFAAGCNETLDTLSLAEEINRHPIPSAKIVATVAESNLINLTAKQIGIRGNYKITATDTTLSVQSMSTGEDPSGGVYGTSKMCYYYNAPVTTLDGLSTRLWKQYGGDKFVFDYPPTLQQEGYYISEVYPTDSHPLDSTVANLPCNYPKGLFTQGFGTHLNQTEISVVHDGELIISTANLPVQERPDGIVDGVNTIFDLSLTSCAGQESLMLWLDGIYQPPIKYVYTDMGSYGRITFLSPPAIEQTLWAWYLPYGTACVDERTRELVGVIDGVNNIFTVPDSPWADALTLVTFLEGLFVLQDLDYSVLTGNTEIKFLGSLSPAVGQSLWSHFNIGSIVPFDNWRQVFVATTDGVTATYMIPHMLLSELPTSTDAVIVFLNGLNQGGNYNIEVDSFGNPTGNIIFNSTPEANRRLEVAYIR